MSSRAERRREARAAAKSAHERTPVLVAGEHPYAGGDEPMPARLLLGEIGGGTPLVLMAESGGDHTVRAYAAEEISDPDTMKFLDNENLMMLAVWCWDCEQPVVEGFDPRSACPA